MFLRWLAAVVVVLLASSSSSLSQSPWRRAPLGFAATASGGTRTCVVGCPAETNVLLGAFDLGGVHRSVDGGTTWQLAMTGWSAPGASGFVFDPRNPRRVLGLSAGGDETVRGHGIYESFDSGATWRQIHSSSVPLEGQLVIDPSSYNQNRRACQRMWLLDRSGRLRRSLDGGASWTALSSWVREGVLAAAPHGGFVYLASAEPANAGVYRSGDGGWDFTWEFRPSISAVAVCGQRPNFVWAIHRNELWLSQNSANSFLRLNDAVLPAGVDGWRAISVCPTDPTRMMLAATDGRVWFSVNGGSNWTSLPGVAASGGHMDPTMSRSWGWYSRDRVWISSGDGVWAGQLDTVVFAWHGGPSPEAAFGGGFQFGPGTESVLLPLKRSQVVYTPDNGASWELRTVDPHNRDGGAVAAFAADARRMFVGHAIGNGTRRLLVSGDGGATWQPAFNPARRLVDWTAGDVITPHATNSSVLFAPGWRSLDGGATWNATPSCQAAFTAGILPPHPVVGRLDTTVMLSTNLGASWLSFTPSFGGFDDVGIDQSIARGYFAAQGSVKTFQSGQWETKDTPLDQFRERNITTVAVDPFKPWIVYAGGRARDYVTEVPVVRSLDGGRTWHNFLPKLGNQFVDGPREVLWMRVNPKTRELWVATDGFGLWIASPP